MARSDQISDATAPTLFLRGRSADSAQEAENWLLSGGQVLIGGDDALLIGDMLRRMLAARLDLQLRMVGDEILLGPRDSSVVHGGPAA